MGANYCHIAVRKDVRDRLRNECKVVFLKHNPEFKGMKITDNHIMNRIIDYYLWGDEDGF